ncbi:MAG: hypothetical protein C0582_00820 [Alphaproteobacteria bacterium]|nr:MAG: hypothetical protein C0582_00820 [Alphaproteobacteria bacterium]
MIAIKNLKIRNEQLQSTFNQIYLLREQILEQTDGEAIKKLGNKISSLEQEEKTLKARIRAMVQSPLPPRVMSKTHQEHLKKGNTNQVEYDLKLKSFIQELSIKVTSSVQSFQKLALAQKFQCSVNN